MQIVFQNINENYNKTMMTANEIRESFKAFFASKGHTIVPSAPMVIKGDPTLMFTNAGMNQWKDVILGIREPELRASHQRDPHHRIAGRLVLIRLRPYLTEIHAWISRSAGSVGSSPADIRGNRP